MFFFYFVQMIKTAEEQYSFQDLKSVKELFTEVLASCKEHLTIVIDSLDQLRDYGAGLKDWIPKTLNNKITFVMSAIPGDQYRVVPELQVNNIFCTYLYLCKPS